MRERKVPVAGLARQTGLSPTTIRYLGMSARPNGVTLVAISAVLGWRCDHLGNILRGEPGKNVRVRPPAQADLLLSVRAASMALRESGVGGVPGPQSPLLGSHTHSQVTVAVSCVVLPAVNRRCCLLLRFRRCCWSRPPQMPNSSASGASRD